MKYTGDLYVDGNSGTILKIFTFLILVYGMFFIWTSDPLNLLVVNKVNVYEADGSLLPRGYLKVIDNNYYKYSDSPYDYVSEIQDKDFRVEATIKVDEVDSIGDRIKIKSSEVTGTEELDDMQDRKFIIYIDNDSIEDDYGIVDTKKIYKGVKITFNGELNNIGDKYYIINDLNKLEVK